MVTRKPAARAIIYAAALGELSLEQANQLLAWCGFEPVPEPRWKTIIENECPLFKREPRKLGEFIIHQPAILERD